MLFQYARIENDSIAELYESHPGWLNDQGSLLSDEELAKHQVYKVDYETKKPEYDELFQIVTPKPDNQWEIDHTTATVYVIYDVIDLTLDDVKSKFVNKIRQAFKNEFENGWFTSKLGFNTDCRRSDIYNDIQNLQGLIELAESLSQTEIQWKDKDGNLRILSLDDARFLLKEMGLKILWNYQYKWQKLDELEKITTLEDLKAFEVWNLDDFYAFRDSKLVTPTNDATSGA